MVATTLFVGFFIAEPIILFGEQNKYKDKVKAKNGRKVTKTFKSRAEYHRGEWLAWENYIARAQKWMLPAKGKRVDPETWESVGAGDPSAQADQAMKNVKLLLEEEKKHLKRFETEYDDLTNQNW